MLMPAEVYKLIVLYLLVLTISHIGIVVALTPISNNFSTTSTSNVGSNMSPQINRVMITGANGYLASHIVKILLEKGISVNACVRDATNESSVKHLTDLPSSTEKLKLFSTGDMGDKSLHGRYDEPLKNCDAVFHAATPLSPKLTGKEFDGVKDMLNPGMDGTQELLDSILRSDSCKSIKCLVLTSSMSAAAPSPEPPIKDESHWSDDVAQLSRENFYGCLKTRQERLCQEWSKKNVEEGKLCQHFRFVAVLPTMILGPPVGYAKPDVENGNGAPKYTPTGTMGVFTKWLQGGKTQATNDSMSFIHVVDCAAMHIAGLLIESASGRYFSLVESWHWNDILKELKELNPNMPLVTFYDEEDQIQPTQFDLTRMNSLGVKVMGMKEIMEESVEFLKGQGLL